MRHILFSGLAGCGKTTTAKAVSHLDDTPFFEISSESVRSSEDLARLFERFPGDGYDPKTGEKIGEINPAIVFVDEAHRLTLKSEEMLGIAMENFRHTYMVGRGRNKRPQTAWVPEFTLICATTKEGDLSKPFRDRFKFTMIFGSYSYEESKLIVALHANKKGIFISPEAIEEIAQRGRGTPRILVRYLDATHDFMSFMGKNKITADTARAQFQLQGIDHLGLTESDTIIMQELYDSESPKGLDSLAVKTNLDQRTIAEVNEPYLILLGFIERTKGGRVITDKGAQHLAQRGLIEAPEKVEGGGRIIRRTEG